MKPNKPENTAAQSEFFKIRLESFLNMRHPLIRLAREINWEFFEKEFGKNFTENKGRPGLSTRLMVGLTYLKHTYNCSDEMLIEQFLESGYWQYFCGFEYFQHEFPCDSSSMTRFRKKIGDEGAEKLLRETLQVARNLGALKVKHLSQVVTDTTVQEKNITFPTDAKLCAKAAQVLVKEASIRGIVLRQKYPFVLKYFLLKYSGYAHAKQYNRAKNTLKKIKTILGRIMRDIERKGGHLDEKFIEKMNIARVLLKQERHSKNKIYSIHEPQTECIAKGKAHKKYEFGCKVSFTTTVKSNYVIGAMALKGNPFDGHTLKEAVKQAEILTGNTIKDIFADKGYRGSEHWPIGKGVYLSGRKNLTPTMKRLLKRRSAIEPIIGHMKHDHRMSRNLLKGTAGDRINPILAAAAFNLRKNLRYIEAKFFLCLKILLKKMKMEGQILLPIHF